MQRTWIIVGAAVVVALGLYFFMGSGTQQPPVVPAVTEQPADVAPDATVTTPDIAPDPATDSATDGAGSTPEPTGAMDSAPENAIESPTDAPIEGGTDAPDAAIEPAPANN